MIGQKGLGESGGVSQCSPYQAASPRIHWVAGVKYPYRNWQDIVAGRHIETVSQVNAVSATRVPVLPEGIKYMILRKHIIRRSHRKKRTEKREIQPVLAGIRA
jgi:hypothetical protein